VADTLRYNYTDNCFSVDCLNQKMWKMMRYFAASSIIKQDCGNLHCLAIKFLYFNVSPDGKAQTQCARTIRPGEVGPNINKYL
jgi:hypothetical protein